MHPGLNQLRYPSHDIMGGGRHPLMDSVIPKEADSFTTPYNLSTIIIANYVPAHKTPNWLAG